MKSRETSFSRQVFTTLQREAKIESTFMKPSLHTSGNILEGNCIQVLKLAANIEG